MTCYYTSLPVIFCVLLFMYQTHPTAINRFLKVTRTLVWFSRILKIQKTLLSLEKCPSAKTQVSRTIIVVVVLDSVQFQSLGIK